MSQQEPPGRTPDNRDPLDRMNDLLAEKLVEIRQRLEAKGASQAEAAERSEELILQVIEDQAPSFAAQLEADAPTFASDSIEYTQGFVERLRVHWGEALDLFWGVIAAVEDSSRRCIRRNRDRVRVEQDWLFDALVQLNGQALRVAREIHTLLTNGYPLGATALSRTIYELAVRATVLAEHGRSPDHLDLAERFLEHARVIEYRDLVEFNKNAERLGYDAVPEEDLAVAKEAHDAALQRFGNAFGRPYGWTIGLPGVTSGRYFSPLEQLADTAHRRHFYQRSSHLLHGDAGSLRLSQVERGGLASVLTNATNKDLTDAADHAMYGLLLTFTNLTRASVPAAPADLYVVATIRLLIERTQEALSGAEESVADAEQRLQQELAAQGQRMTPFGVVDL